MKYNKYISRALRTSFFAAENLKYFKEKIFLHKNRGAQHGRLYCQRVLFAKCQLFRKKSFKKHIKRMEK